MLGGEYFLCTSYNNYIAITRLQNITPENEMHCLKVRFTLRKKRLFHRRILPLVAAADGFFKCRSHSLLVVCLILNCDPQSVSSISGPFPFVLLPFIFSLPQSILVS